MNDENQMEHPVVFISYSWDGDKHQDWVLTLANRLRENGIDVILDRYYLTPGKNLPYFVENSLQLCNRVIIVLTPNYKEKADRRIGGVGQEYSMLNIELLQNISKNDRIIPILKEGAVAKSIPQFLQQYIYIDFREDKKFKENYEELVREIYQEPKIKIPALGKKPVFKNSTQIDHSDELGNYVIKAENAFLKNDVKLAFILIKNASKLGGGDDNYNDKLLNQYLEYLSDLEFQHVQEYKVSSRRKFYAVLIKEFKKQFCLLYDFNTNENLLKIEIDKAAQNIISFLDDNALFILNEELNSYELYNLNTLHKVYSSRTLKSRNYILSPDFRYVAFQIITGHGIACAIVSLESYNELISTESVNMIRDICFDSSGDFLIILTSNFNSSNPSFHKPSSEEIVVYNLVRGQKVFSSSCCCDLMDNKTFKITTDSKYIGFIDKIRNKIIISVYDLLTGKMIFSSSGLASSRDDYKHLSGRHHYYYDESFKFSQDGKYLALLLRQENNNVQGLVYDLENQKELICLTDIKESYSDFEEYRDDENSTGYTTNMNNSYQFSGDSNHILFIKKRSKKDEYHLYTYCVVFSLKSGQKVLESDPIFTGSYNYDCMSGYGFNQNGKYLLISTANNKSEKIYDLVNYEEVQQMEPIVLNHEMNNESVSGKNDSKLNIKFDSIEGVVKIFDGSEDKVMRIIRDKDYIVDFHLSLNQNYLLCATKSKTLKLIDISIPKRKLVEHYSSIIGIINSKSS